MATINQEAIWVLAYLLMACPLDVSTVAGGGRLPDSVEIRVVDGWGRVIETVRMER